MEMLNTEIEPELKKILKEFENALNKKGDFDLGFNIFSLVSDTYYRENFHSEIIHALLDPNGKHGERRLFLDEFLSLFLNDEDTIEKYQDCRVNNEESIDGKRRIDLLICSESNAIIIENKMNNAIDMDNQLPAYYEHCRNKGLTVDAIIYLSLDGNKTPDKNKWKCSSEIESEIENKLCLLAAFGINPSSKTIHNWLERCKEKSKKEDNKFIIKQYQQLLKHLRKFIMEKEALKKYHDFISKPENEGRVDEIMQLIKLQGHLHTYYPQKLKDEIDIDYTTNSCFSNSKLYGSTCSIFENIGGDKNYYLMVCFSAEGDYNIDLKDNSRVYAHNYKLEKRAEFIEKFSFDNRKDWHGWEYKNKRHDLITDFDKFLEEFAVTLKIVSEIIKEPS